jgi:hypothetical protein
MRRLSSRILFYSTENLARVPTDSGRALALAPKTPKEAIESIMVSLRQLFSLILFCSESFFVLAW